jgi:hypothetical protein
MTSGSKQLPAICTLSWFRCFNKKTYALSFAACATILLLFTGCGLKYTQALDKSLEKSKIPAGSFVVFPVIDMSYAPPSSCLWPANTEDGQKYQDNWNKEVKKQLTRTFPNEKWLFLTDDSTRYLENQDVIRQTCQLANQKAVSQLVSVASEDKIDYIDGIADTRMAEILKKISDSANVNYAIIFTSPSLSGEVHTTYNSNGGFTSTTYYTSTVRAQVWDCTTGKLLFCSGGWNKSSGFCFFVSPQDMSIQNSTGQILDRLTKIISHLLKYGPGPSVARL